MKTIAKTHLLSLLILIGFAVKAQEYKTAIKTGGKVKIMSISGSIIVKSHTGNEVIIQGPEIKNPEKAEGLTLVSGGGNDNTGLGLNVETTDYGLQIKGASRKERKYTILIPEKVSIAVHSQGWQAHRITIDGVKSEIEIKSEYAQVDLINVTGPVVLNATYGKIHADFSQVNQEKPISLIATYSDLELKLPESTKAKVKMQSEYGDIYTDFKIAYDKTTDDDDDSWLKLSKSTVSGTINGGGVEIYLKSPYSNIYLRKK
jgi:hypothetical protein